MQIHVKTNDPIPKLAILYDREALVPYEYMLLHGGRGGGKTEEVARFLVLNTFADGGHVLCTREIQNSIQDSVFATIENWIDKLDLTQYFHVTQNSITNKVTGAKFIFRGMNAGTKKDAIKSLAGVKYVWCEEAQSISANSIEKLNPTIRTEGRLLIFTFNPDTPHDAVNVLRDYGDKVLDIEVNYYDNPYCPQVLIDQALTMKRLYPELYKHVWEGHPASMSDAYTVLPYNLLRKCIDAHKKLAQLYPDTDWTAGHAYGGLDLAPGEEEKHDKNSMTYVKGSVVLHSEHWQSSELDAIARKVKRHGKRWNILRLYFDAVGVGGFANGTLKKHKPGFKLEPHMGGSKVFGPDKIFFRTSTDKNKGAITNHDYFKNAKSQMWWNLRLRMENTIKLLEGNFDEVRDKTNFISFDSNNPELEMLLIELSQATYNEDASGRILIDKAPGDKEIILPDGKKKKVRSPNLADSCGLALLRSCRSGLKAN